MWITRQPFSRQYSEHAQTSISRVNVSDLKGNIIMRTSVYFSTLNFTPTITLSSLAVVSRVKDLAIVNIIPCRVSTPTGKVVELVIINYNSKSNGTLFAALLNKNLLEQIDK